MKLDIEHLIELSKVAIQAAREAGGMISEHAGGKITYEKKDAGASLASQVVTKVDCMSQDIVLKHIGRTCKPYDLGFLAEESPDDYSRLEKEFFWCIDPLDGTLPFIESRPGYAVSIALVSRDGIPYIGVVYDPLEHTLYHAARGIGAFCNEEPWVLSSPPSETFDTIDRGGAVMNACWVLEHGAACFYKEPKTLNGGGCVWDYAATACLFETLGAWVSDMQGNPLDLNRKDSVYMNQMGVLFASNEEIARQIIGN